jgi:nucleoside-diphosphate-sugar epimerase
VYGPDVDVPTLETAAKAPFNPYGEHKLIGETVLAEAFSGDGRDYASLRFSNVYGPRQSALGEGGVVAIFARRMVLGETPVIYGDGGQTRDFIYVADVCDAILAALEFEGRLADEGPDGHSYNISTGARIDVESLAGLLRQATGYTGVIAHEPARDGDVRDSALDPAKAARTLGWRATVELGSGLVQTARWFAREAR